MDKHSLQTLVLVNEYRSFVVWYYNMCKAFLKQFISKLISICFAYRNSRVVMGDLISGSKILQVFQLNILNNLVFMHKIKSQTASAMVPNKFRKPTHTYLHAYILYTNSSTSNYSIPLFKLGKIKCRISIRVVILWKSISANFEKNARKCNRF